MDSKIDFKEYLNMVASLKQESVSFGQQNQIGEKSASTTTGFIEGTKHTYEHEERNTIARLFNNILEGDEYVKDRFPIDPESDELWHVMSDGMVLIRVLNIIEPDSVDMRTVNKGRNGNLNIFEVRQNIVLGLTAAKGKIKLIGVDASVFLEKKPHMLLGVCW